MTDNSDSDYSFLSDFTLPSNISFSTEFDETLIGSHRFPISLKNIYRTCFIDSVLNSIANCETLTKHFKDILPSITTKQIEQAFSIKSMKNKNILSSLISNNYNATNNLSRLYEILVALFIRSIDNSKDHILLYIRIYIMYLENMDGFNNGNKSKTKQLQRNMKFYDYVCNTDYNFISYFNYCYEIQKDNYNNISYTGVLNNNLIRKLNLNYFIRKCDISEIQYVLNNNTTHDVFVEIIYDSTLFDLNYIEGMFRTCIKRYNGNYLCTDIIFDKYEQESYTPYHSVYYNINQSKLLDDGELIETDINRLSKPLDDGDYYVPCILHFQLRQ